MGRELVVQLVTEGCSVAMCDVNDGAMAETVRLAEAAAPAGVRITASRCDVSDEASVSAFRDDVLAAHATTSVGLLFNNAGIGGGGSFVAGRREDWDRTFGVCWGGVYHCTRAFLPLLVASDEAWLVNTSSVNGFWASLGPGTPHTAYSTAKFAVKGFSEALLADLAVNAPHVHVSVVMPGHIGTDIVRNSRQVHGAEDIDAVRVDMARRGVAVDGLSDAEVGALIDSFADAFRDTAPMTAGAAATVILDGVRAGRWRILVGDDAVALDVAVRADPEGVYNRAGVGLTSIRAAAD